MIYDNLESRSRENYFVQIELSYNDKLLWHSEFPKDEFNGFHCNY